MPLLDRVAGAPITWGVCEAPGWGVQLDPNRVLREMRAIGLHATELGPDDFLPAHPQQLRTLLERNDLLAAGGFVPLVLHRRDLLDAELGRARVAAQRLAECDADVMVVSAVEDAGGYESTTEVDDRAWLTLIETLDQVCEIGASHGLTVALHPHRGTVVENRGSVYRFLESSSAALCVDTGHLLLGGADPLEVATAAGDRVVHVHLKDVDGRLARAVRTGAIGYREAARQGLYRPLGQGEIDMAGVVHALEASGYGGWYVVEQDAVLEVEPPEGEGPIADAERSLEWLREFADQGSVRGNGQVGTGGTASLEGAGRENR